MRGEPADSGPAVGVGERWARELLGELRDAGWRPAAWRRFVERSLARAGETARARPELARQARRWSAVGIAASTGAAALARGSGLPAPRLRAATAWSAASGIMLWWHIGMVEGPAGEPRCALSAADAVSYARVLAAPAMLAAADDRRLFMCVLVAGAGCDAIDGALARRSGTTRLGRDLDAAADVAFFTGASLAAGRAGLLARPAVVALGARELSLVSGSALHYFARATPPPANAVGATRFAGPALTLGLALAGGGRRRLGGAVVIGSSAAAAARHAAVLARGG